MFSFSRPSPRSSPRVARRSRPARQRRWPLPLRPSLVDADAEIDAASYGWAAPVGTYEGRVSAWECLNPAGDGDPAAQDFPLNADGDIWWSWGNQYMFVRIEGNRRVLPATRAGPFFYHVSFAASVRPP